jgi:hypothetical protein
MSSLLHVNILNKTDIVLQIAACTFDAHIQEILGTLICGATLIMLHPHGNMDFLYASQTLQNKQVTHILSVPSYLAHLNNIVKNCNISCHPTIQTVCCIGKWDRIDKKMISFFTDASCR